MTWDDVKGFIGSAAPVVGTLLAPETGGASLAVGTLISKALGTSNTPDAVMQELQNNPDAILKIKELANSKEIAKIQANVQLAQIDLDDTKAHLSDVASARSREIESEKITGKRDINLYVLAWTIVVGFLALVILLTYVTIPKDSTGVVFMLFGALATSFGTVIQYFFGSSKSSSDKTHLLSKAQQIKE